MRVAIYCRVSRPDETDILENQKRNAKEYCTAHGFTDFQMYEDVFSGGQIDRPGLNQLRDDIKARQIKLVVFTSLSRMTRGGIDAALYILKELEQNNVGWHFVEQPVLNFDANTTPLAKDIILAVLAAVDKEYRRNISQKTIAALARRKALGLHNGRHPKNCQCPKHSKRVPSSNKAENQT